MRNKRLDVLRGVAVLAVVLYHGPLQNRVTRVGWAGVDLFFVLSGFLISGLLFVEYQKTGSINLRRFYVRRGLKLYPAFYIFLIATAIAEAMFHHLRPLGTYLSEMFYVQNYGPALWPHTWSLAVEEHFYICLPLMLILLIRGAGGLRDPFRALPWIFAFVAAACLLFRIAAVMRIPDSALSGWETVKPVFARTHERMDSLLFGVLIGYAYHFRRPSLDKILASRRNQLALSVLCAAMLLPIFIWPSASRFLLTIGFTLAYLGFGLMLVLSLQVRNILWPSAAGIISRLGSFVAYIGMYSYSIYLWHEAVLRWQGIFMEKVLGVRVGIAESYISYLVASVALGIVMSRAIEYPILRLRDRLLPGVETVSQTVVPLPSAAKARLIFS